MQAVLALTAALAWGSGNFTMGLAGKRGSPRATVAIGFATGLLGALVFLAFHHAVWTWEALLWGMAAGLAQGIGWMSFSRALYLGHISVVCPLAAATTTVELYSLGLLDHGTVSALSFIGALVALSAIVLLNRTSATEPDNTANNLTPARAAVFAMIAGTLFALQSLALKAAGSTSSSLVVTGAGLGVVILIGITCLWRPISRQDLAASRAPAIFGGLIIFLGDVTYIYALTEGPLPSVSVLGQLHPLFTVVLAQLVLREKLTPVMIIGIALAVIGGALITAY